MEKLTVPEALRGLPSETEDALGPFVLEHNGAVGVAAYLEWNGDHYAIWNGSRTLVVGDTYAARVDDDQIEFTSTHYWSRLVLRPLTLEDAAWALPGEPPPATLEHLLEDVLDQLDAGF